VNAARAGRVVVWGSVLAGGMVALAASDLPAASGDGVVVGFRAARVAGLAAGTYLGVVLLLRAVALGLGSRRWLRLADSVTVPVARRLLDTMLGAAALLAVTGGSVAAEGAATNETPPVLRHLDDDGVGLPPAAPAETDPTTGGEGAPTSWTVAPGDHLWSIAERVMTRVLARQPTHAETARYWVDLIDANRSRLVHPEVPDLIYAGQNFVLPPVP
jgi:hypothetical protein